MRLQGKKAVITGGGSGIGKAIALRFAEQGAQVLIAARRSERLAETARLSPRIDWVSVDLTAPEGPQQLVQAAAEKLGGIDVLVNNSGIFLAETIEKTPDDLYDKLFAVNVKALYRLTQAALPVLRKSSAPAIVNIGSIVALAGLAQTTCYSATKGAVVQITKSLAVELGSEKIRVNCVCPGLIHTELTDQMMSDPDFAKMALPAYPLGRFGEVDDIAYACVYLASDEASWLTGVILPVDGGYTAC